MSEVLEARSGLDEVRTLIDGTSDYRGIAQLMGVKPVLAEEGHVVFEGRPTKDVYNPIGTVHGGYAATLLDSAMGCAVFSTLVKGDAWTCLLYTSPSPRDRTR